MSQAYCIVVEGILCLDGRAGAGQEEQKSGAKIYLSSLCSDDAGSNPLLSCVVCLSLAVVNAETGAIAMGRHIREIGGVRK